MDLLFTVDWLDIVTIASSSYFLIFAAEIGDKSQLVCVALAAKYRASPVIFGASLAFILLNSLAVMFGLAIANWIPEVIISSIVAVLFAGFGIHALRAEESSDDENVVVSSGRRILMTTFLLITVAEFGDKTQLTVVALSSTSMPLAVWIGSTLALVTTSGLGVWAGRTVLQKMPISLLHRISGLIFILFAVLAAYNSFQLM